MKNAKCMEPEPPFFAWNRSRPNLVGAGVDSGTSDFRSRSRQKKWQLRNTAEDNKIQKMLNAFNCEHWTA